MPSVSPAALAFVKARSATPVCRQSGPPCTSGEHHVRREPDPRKQRTHGKVADAVLRGGVAEQSKDGVDDVVGVVLLEERVHDAQLGFVTVFCSQRPALLPLLQTPFTPRPTDLGGPHVSGLAPRQPGRAWRERERLMRDGGSLGRRRSSKPSDARSTWLAVRDGTRSMTLWRILSSFALAACSSITRL